MRLFFLLPENPSVPVAASCSICLQQQIERREKYENDQSAGALLGCV